MPAGRSSWSFLSLPGSSVQGYTVVSRVLRQIELEVPVTTAFPAMIRGTVHGKTIELENELGLPEGQPVSLFVQPAGTPGDGIRQSAGAWAEDAEELDAWLNQLRASRQQDRRGYPS
jgi:hypothetical protein